MGCCSQDPFHPPWVTGNAGAGLSRRWESARSRVESHSPGRGIRAPRRSPCLGSGRRFPQGQALPQLPHAGVFSQLPLGRGQSQRQALPGRGQAARSRQLLLSGGLSCSRPSQDPPKSPKSASALEQVSSSPKQTTEEQGNEGKGLGWHSPYLDLRGKVGQCSGSHKWLSSCCCLAGSPLYSHKQPPSPC